MTVVDQTCSPTKIYRGSGNNFLASQLGDGKRVAWNAQCVLWFSGMFIDADKYGLTTQCLEILFRKKSRKGEYDDDDEILKMIGQ